MFSNWSGDAKGNANPLEITLANENLSIYANFTEDTNDDDNDGLSNYDESVTYHTNINDNDSDDDGILDGAKLALVFRPLNQMTLFKKWFLQSRITHQHLTFHQMVSALRI